MTKNIIHQEGLAAHAASGTEIKTPPSVIKLGIHVHSSFHVVVAQWDHELPRPPRRVAPHELAPWVETLRRAGPSVHAVYEACGLGFGLQRQLTALGTPCHVIAPCKLDERNQLVKTDGRDATALCQRLSRYIDGHRRELAVIRVPREEEEKARAVHRQREASMRRQSTQKWDACCGCGGKCLWNQARRERARAAGFHADSRIAVHDLHPSFPRRRVERHHLVIGLGRWLPCGGGPCAVIVIVPESSALWLEKVRWVAASGGLSPWSP